MRPLRILADREAQSRISRRALLAGFAVAGACPVLAGCGGTSFAASAGSNGKLENQLNVYSWGDYSDPSDIAAFSKKYGRRCKLRRTAPIRN